MEDNTRISVVGIIIEDRSSAEQVNELLHQYGDYIIGRMGLPYAKKKVNMNTSPVWRRWNPASV